MKSPNGARPEGPSVSQDAPETDWRAELDEARGRHNEIMQVTLASWVSVIEASELRATTAENEAASWKADAASEFLKRQEAEAERDVLAMTIKAREQLHGALGIDSDRMMVEVARELSGKFLAAKAQHEADHRVIERLKEAFKPFAKAAKDCDDETVPDHVNIWKSAIAISVTHGHFRQALALLEGVEKP